MQKTMLLCAALTALCGAMPAVAQTPASPIKRTVVQQVDIPGTKLEAIYAVVDIPAGVKAPRHSHPGVLMAQIVEGDFVLAIDGQPEKIYHAGEAYTLPDRAIHSEAAGADKAVKLNVIFLVEKGAPLASPAP